MTRLTKFLRRAHARLRLARSIHVAGWWFLGAACAFVPLAVFDRLYALGLPVYSLFGAGVLFALLLGVVRGQVDHTPLVEIAEAVDARLETEERLSTALAFADAGDPFVRKVRSEAFGMLPGLRVEKAFPIRTPRSVYLALLVAVIGILCAECVGRLDVLGKQEAKERLDDEKHEVKAHAVVLEKRAKRLLDGTEERDFGRSVRLVEEFHAVSKDLASRPHTRRQALVKLSKIGDKLNREYEKSLGLGRLGWRTRAAKGFNRSSEVADALGREDFQKAAEAARKLAGKMGAKGSSKLGAEQRKDLASELNKLAKMAKQDAPELSKTLEQAAKQLAAGDEQGAKQSLAKAADQLQMMQQMANSSPLVKKAGQYVAQAKQSMSGGGSGQACPKCGLPLNEFGNCPACSGRFGAPGNQGQGQPGMGGSMGQGGAVGTRLQPGQGGTGQPGMGRGQGGVGAQGGLAGLGGDRLAGGNQGDPNGQPGGAFGGPGRGRGGVAPKSGNKDGRWTDVTVRGKIHPGDVLASVRVKGLPRKGDAAVKYAEVYAEYKRQAEESLGRDPIPLGYREHVKDYFDEIEPQEQ